ncbi:hypothetical protein COHA_001664 [Chlorella ohadii]|uniref:Starch synthase, chloroplastic/amyloplastic n=1 Tax=Chlorella ohadii TaxID=2649997 RepID=A0AAD5E1U3_9CHLO|nr:hypothetical protein COHA_001664 [Chlorella ohadii]
MSHPPCNFLCCCSTAGQSALAAAMLAVGLATPLSEFRRVLRSPGRALDGWAAQLIAMPVLALALCYAMGLPLPYAIGLCLVACCPGGSAAGVVGHLAGGDVPLSVLLTAASALAAGVTVPLLGKLLLGTWLPAATSGLALSTLQAVLLPALAGSALGEVFPGTAATLRPLCTLCAAGLMAAHCASYIAHSGGALRYAGPRLLGAVIAMHAGSLLLGYGLCRMLGQPRPAARSAGIQASMRNSALAGQLAVAAFPAHPAAALPCVLSACVHTVLGTLAALYFKARDGAADGQRAAAAAAAGEQHSHGSSSGGGGGDSGGGGPPGGPEEPFSALLEAVEMMARQVAPLAQRASEQLAPLAAAASSTLTAARTTTRAGVHAALQAGASLLVPGLMEELEGQLKGLEQAELDVPPQEERERGRPGAKAPANPLAMSVVMVGAECAPWSKTGGLGDVMQALPKALAARGHRLMVVAPLYKRYPEAVDTGVRLRLQVCGSETEVGFWHAQLDGVDYTFLDHPAFSHWADQIYGGSRQDVLYRCALLSKAALEAPRLLPGGEAGALGEGCLFVANDFHAALVPVYLQAHYRDHGQMLYARSLLVVHNLAHQGRGPPEELGMLDLPDDYYKLFSLRDAHSGSWMMNVLKAGAIASHRIVAVSNQYAQEVQTAEHGFGLDDTLRRQAWKLTGKPFLTAAPGLGAQLCTGVVNGIDTAEWSPAADVHLGSDGYRRYDAASLDAGKAACKAALQRELGLPVDPDAPLLGFIGRLDPQKGVDLIADNYEWLMEQGAQLVLLGSGREDLEAALREMEARAPRQCRAWVGFSVKLAHRMTAGVDLLLMPSRFEPCGLNQLYAMAYGTVPVVHAVGGLADTVQPFNPYEGTGTGWTFTGADPAAFRQALAFALQTYREHRDSFRDIQLRGMSQDLSWGAAAQQYEAVLLAAKYQW